MSENACSLPTNDAKQILNSNILFLLWVQRIKLEKYHKHKGISISITEKIQFLNKCLPNIDFAYSIFQNKLRNLIRDFSNVRKNSNKKDKLNGKVFWTSTMQTKKRRKKNLSVPKVPIEIFHIFEYQV